MANQNCVTVTRGINDILKELNMHVAKGYNIIRKHWGNKGLHLNEYMALQLATIRKLWKSVGSLNCSFDEKPTESTNRYVFKSFETTEGNCKDGPFEVF